MTEAEIKAHVARGANERMLRLALHYAAQGMAFDCAWAPELVPRASPKIPRNAFTRTTTTAAENNSMPSITSDTGYRPRRASSVEQFQELRRAEAECAAYVPNPLAFDSADAVYGAALTRMGVDARTVRNLMRYPGTAGEAFRGRRAHGSSVRQATRQDLERREQMFGPNAGRAY